MKLAAIGQVCEREDKDDDINLNPGKLEEIMKRREERDSVKRKLLMDKSLSDMKQKKMFDEEERTNHKDITPARFRLSDFKRKSLNKLF